MEQEGIIRALLERQRGGRLQAAEFADALDPEAMSVHEGQCPLVEALLLLVQLGNAEFAYG